MEPERSLIDEKGMNDVDSGSDPRARALISAGRSWSDAVARPRLIPPNDAVARLGQILPTSHFKHHILPQIAHNGNTHRLILARYIE